MVAAAISVLLGMADLAVQYGFSLVVQVRDQRIADVSAYAGALAYTNSTASGTTAAAQSAASYLTSLNGNSSVGASIVVSPRGDGNNAVQAVVSTSYQVKLRNATLAISEQGTAEIVPGATACIIALTTSGTEGNGILMSGGVSLSAPNCTVATNAAVSAACGTTITTKQLDWDSSSYSNTTCNNSYSNVVTSSDTLAPVKKAATANPLSGNTEIAALMDQLSAVNSMTAPSGPSVSGGTNITFANSVSGSTTFPVDGCTGSFVSSTVTWTVTCPAGGNYTFGSLNVSTGVTVNFDTAHTTSTYNFSGIVDNEGTLNFGSGTFNMAAGLENGASSSSAFVMTMGSGTYNIGKSPYTCGAGQQSICTFGPLTIAGPVNMTLSNGIYNGGNSAVSIGANSTANSYDFGPSDSDGYAINQGGASGSMTLASAASGSFDIVGNISNASNGGASCMTLPAAGQHNIYGFINSNGGITLGSGIWTVSKYVEFGGSGGGNVTCGGTSVGVEALDVTLVIGGSTTDTNGCAGFSFCAQNGFATINITAPTSGSLENLVVVGPTVSSNTTGIYLTAGTTSTDISGTLYYPYGTLQTSGGNGLGTSSSCLEIIVNQITMSEGAATSSSCPNIAGVTSTGTSMLVQ
jgi:hypothetical protein